MSENLYFLKHIWLINDAVHQSQPSSATVPLTLSQITICQAVRHILHLIDTPEVQATFLISLQPEDMLSSGNIQGFRV